MFFFVVSFFFQAEDGIRDLVRSRGLGDVYKRQVVSDGVGSKPFSSFGSDAACLAVELAVLTCCPDGEIERNSLFSSIQANWLRLVAPLEPRDCAATCLFALRLDGVIHIGMLLSLIHI